MCTRRREKAAYAAPTPQVFYIHDDLSDLVRQTHGEASPAFRLTQELWRVVRQNPQRVVVLQLEEQLARVLAHQQPAPFAVALGLGRAGERVARQIHARAGWFPVIYRIDITREEDGQGAYTLISPTLIPLAPQLARLEEFATAASLAVVDDTVFSGQTMRTVLHALPPALLARTHAFCLRGVAESLASVRALCPLTIGFAAPGRILDEVSFINASGMVLRVGIRRAGQPPMAFFERPAWMHAWFPGYAAEVIALCRQLNTLLEPATAPPRESMQPE